jgi:hypothetical protein
LGQEALDPAAGIVEVLGHGPAGGGAVALADGGSDLDVVAVVAGADLLEGAIWIDGVQLGGVELDQRLDDLG